MDAGRYAVHPGIRMVRFLLYVLEETGPDALPLTLETRSAIQIVDHQRTGLVLLDEDLHVVYLNAAAESLLGRSIEQSLGLSTRELLDTDEQTMAALDRSLRTTESITIRKLELGGPDRSRIQADVNVSLLPDLTGILLELHPVDSQLRFSRDDQLASQQETSLQFIRGLAHEVKNPLGGIRGAAQLLERELPAAHLREYTEIILAEVDRLRELVDRMMRLRTTPRMDDCNVHEVLERVLTLTRAEHGDSVELVRDYDPSLPNLMADHDQLVQACLNVVRNACQALATTPHACIQVRTRIARQVTIGRQRYRSAIRIDIEDNGPGVDPALAERIFFPMISGRPEGSGLGLALTQTIITDHRGIIECTSRPGRTTFTMTLPLIQAQVASASTPDSA